MFCFFNTNSSTIHDNSNPDYTSWLLWSYMVGETGVPCPTWWHYHLTCWYWTHATLVSGKFVIHCASQQTKLFSFIMIQCFTMLLLLSTPPYRNFLSIPTHVSFLINRYCVHSLTSLQQIPLYNKQFWFCLIIRLQCSTEGALYYFVHFSRQEMLIQYSLGALHGYFSPAIYQRTLASLLGSPWNTDWQHLQYRLYR